MGDPGLSLACMGPLSLSLPHVMFFYHHKNGEKEKHRQGECYVMSSDHN